MKTNDHCRKRNVYGASFYLAFGLVRGGLPDWGPKAGLGENFSCKVFPWASEKVFSDIFRERENKTSFVRSETGHHLWGLWGLWLAIKGDRAGGGAKPMVGRPALTEGRVRGRILFRGFWWISLVGCEAFL